MKNKILSLVFAGIFVFILLAGLTAAVDLFEMNQVSAPTSISNDAGSFDVVFNIKYNGVLPSITVDLSSIVSTGTGIVTFSDGPSDITLTPGVAKEVTATITFNSGQTGSIAGTITATPSSGDTKNLPFSAELTVPVPDWRDDFCVYDEGINGNPGDLRVSIGSPTVTGFGDDNQWLPFDSVEVEVEVSNRGDDDVDNIEVEWGLYDEQADEWVIEVDREDDIDLSDGDEETLAFTLTIDDKMDIDLEDLDDGDHYVLYVRATGEVDNDDNNDSCATDREDIEIVIERDFAMLQDIQTPEVVQCGGTFDFAADVWNIGSRNQDEITVEIFNNDLGINQIIDVGDLDSFDSKKIHAQFIVPKDAEEKSYYLNMEVHDEDENVYVNDFNDDESIANVLFNVDGGCSTSGLTQEDVSLDANLVSGGEAGQPLVIKATVTNSGDKTATLVIGAAGFGGWASGSIASPDTLTLDSGESADVLLTLNVNDDAVSGDNVFNIEVVSQGELVAEQPVSVTITGKSSGGLGNIFGDNSFIWIFVIVDIILIAIIIMVALRVSKK